MTNNITEPIGLKFEEIDESYPTKEAIIEAKRCLNCKNPTCVKGCPIENNIPGFIHQLSMGNMGAALAIINEKSNLPAICGRVEIEPERHGMLRAAIAHLLPGFFVPYVAKAHGHDEGAMVIRGADAHGLAGIDKGVDGIRVRDLAVHSSHGNHRASPVSRQIFLLTLYTAGRCCPAAVGRFLSGACGRKGFLLSGEGLPDRPASTAFPAQMIE